MQEGGEDAAVAAVLGKCMADGTVSFEDGDAERGLRHGWWPAGAKEGKGFERLACT